MCEVMCSSLLCFLFSVLLCVVCSIHLIIVLYWQEGAGTVVLHLSYEVARKQADNPRGKEPTPDTTDGGRVKKSGPNLIIYDK